MNITVRNETSIRCNATTCGPCAERTITWCRFFAAEVVKRGKRRVAYERLEVCRGGAGKERSRCSR